jgi:hypothetical protein
MPTPEELEVIRAFRQRQYRMRMMRLRPSVPVTEQNPAREANGMWGYQRTGSMNAGSPILTLTFTSDFQVGDPVIVSTGGEEGLGLYGTVGVGGNRGIVGSNYYESQINPQALIATVIDRNDDGSVLTLSQSAVVSTTNTLIVFDNRSIVQGFNEEVHAPGHEIVYPAGNFYMSNTFGIIGQSAGWLIRGAGKHDTVFRAPTGVQLSMFAFQAHGVEIRDFSIIGNLADDSFGMTGTEYNSGIVLIQTANAIVRNFHAEDVFAKVVWAIGGGADNVLVEDCSCRMRAARREYLAEWLFGVSDSVGGTFNRCTVDSDYLMPGFETFRSNGVIFNDCSSRNGIVACNSSGNFELNDFSIIVEELSQPNQPSDVPHHHLSPIIDVNRNIVPPDPSISAGGVINNMQIIVQGPINSNGELKKGIVINVDNPNITVNGGQVAYPSTPGPSGTDVGARGFSSTGLNTIVNNFTVIGPSRDEFENNIEVEDGAVNNCTATRIRCVGPNCVLT